MARVNEPTAPQRAYDDIKSKLLSGRLRLRQRLDPNAIAIDLGFSTTPVREALLRLAGERLVSFKPSHGFSVSMWSETGLRHLYRWRGELASLALAQGTLAPLNETSGADYPLRITALMNALQRNAHNELVLAANNADDRLFVARAAEAECWPDVNEDYEVLQIAWGEGGLSLSAALEAHYAKRAAAAKDIRETAALLHFPSNGA